MEKGGRGSNLPGDVLCFGPITTTDSYGDVAILLNFTSTVIFARPVV